MPASSETGIEVAAGPAVTHRDVRARGNDVREQAVALVAGVVVVRHRVTRGDHAVLDGRAICGHARRGTRRDRPSARTSLPCGRATRRGRRTRARAAARGAESAGTACSALVASSEPDDRESAPTRRAARSATRTAAASRRAHDPSSGRWGSTAAMMRRKPRPSIGVSTVCPHGRRARTSATRAAAHAVAARGPSRRAPRRPLGGRRRPRAGNPARRVPPGAVPDAGRAAARMVLAREARRGPARAVLAVTVAPASRTEVRDPRRHRVRRRPRRLCPAGRADELDRRHGRCGVRPAPRARLGALGRGVGRARAWPAASTASRSAASSPPSRCSTRARMRRRPPSSASCSDSARRATRLGACSTSSGSRPTSPPSARSRSGEPSTVGASRMRVSLPSAF